MRRRAMAAGLCLIALAVFYLIWQSRPDVFAPVSPYIYRERTVTRGDTIRVIHLTGISQAKAEQLLSQGLTDRGYKRIGSVGGPAFDGITYMKAGDEVSIGDAAEHGLDGVIVTDFHNANFIDSAYFKISRLWTKQTLDGDVLKGDPVRTFLRE